MFLKSADGFSFQVCSLDLSKLDFNVTLVMLIGSNLV